MFHQVFICDTGQNPEMAEESEAGPSQDPDTSMKPEPSDSMAMETETGSMPDDVDPIESEELKGKFDAEEKGIIHNLVAPLPPDEDSKVTMKKTYSKTSTTLIGSKAKNSGAACGMLQKKPKSKKNITPRQLKWQNPQRNIGLRIENVIGNAKDSFSIDEDSPSYCSQDKEYVFIFVFNDEIKSGKKLRNKGKFQMRKNSGLDEFNILDLTSALYDKKETFDEVKLNNDCLSKTVIKSIASKIVKEMFAKNKTKTANLVDIEAEYFVVLNTSLFGATQRKSKPEPTFKKSYSAVISNQGPGCHLWTTDSTSVGSSLLIKDNINEETKNILTDSTKQHMDPNVLVVNTTEKPRDQNCNNDSDNSIISMPIRPRRKYKNKNKINDEDIEQYATGLIVPSLHDVNADSNFRCIKCNQNYKSSISLKRHIKQGCKEIAKSYLCTRCDSKFEKRAALSAHIKTVCRPKPRLKECSNICEYCGKRFKHSSNLWRHREIHKDLKRHRCHECGKGFNRSYSLRHHVKYVHRKEKAYFYCSCGIRSLSKKHIMAHEQTHSIPKGADIPRPFRCNCGKAYISQHKLTIHQNLSHKAKKCNKCDEICGTIYELIKHKKTAHGIIPASSRKAQEETRRCPICDKSLSTPNHLNDHLNNVHRVRIPRSGEKVNCGRCPKAYTSFGSYIFHTRSHHKEDVTESELRSMAENLSGGDGSAKSSEAFVCNQCDKKFSTALRLRNHSYRMHSLPNPNLVCNVCDMKFETKAKYYSHKYSAHVSAEERTCQICSKVFPDKKGLYNHKVMHASTSFLCSDCGSKYKRSGDYRRHMRDKHGLNSV